MRPARRPGSYGRFFPQCAKTILLILYTFSSPSRPPPPSPAFFGNISRILLFGVADPALAAARRGIFPEDSARWPPEQPPRARVWPRLLFCEEEHITVSWREDKGLFFPSHCCARGQLANGTALFTPANGTRSFSVSGITDRPAGQWEGGLQRASPGQWEEGRRSGAKRKTRGRRRARLVNSVTSWSETAARPRRYVNFDFCAEDVRMCSRSDGEMCGELVAAQRAVGREKFIWDFCFPIDLSPWWCF